MPVRTPTPRRPPSGPNRPTAASNLISGAIGGLVVLAIGGTLIGTGLISSGNTARREIIREVPARSAPIATAAGGRSRSVADISRNTAGGVVFISARVVTQSDSPYGLPLKQEGLASGSGFVLDRNGYILTNAHVV